MGTRTAASIHPGKPRRSRPGFTLIEVLVVVAIIALLVAILIPSLSKAKELSKRTVCGSQLHQMNLAIQLYANSFKDQVPIGCYGPPVEKSGDAILAQSNYVIWSGRKWPPPPDVDGDGFQCVGILFKLRYLTDPQNYYCPSGKAEFGLYNTGGNWWLTPWSVTRMSYAMRPEVGFFGRYTTGYIQWTSPGSGAYFKKPLNEVPWPKLGNYKRRVAFLADLSSTMVHKNVHQEGFNVSFSDASAKWGGLFKVKSELSMMSKDYKPEFNEYQIRMWRKFDRF